MRIGFRCVKSNLDGSKSSHAIEDYAKAIYLLSRRHDGPVTNGELAERLGVTPATTMAGQVVMQGFIERQVPIFLRRALTLAPALLILALGVDPTNALIGSQVVLSFGIPSRWCRWS